MDTPADLFARLGLADVPGVAPADLRLFHEDLSSDARTYLIGVPGQHAVGVWRVLRERAPETGYSPVIVGDLDEDAFFHLGRLTDPLDNTPVSAILAEAARTNAPAWVDEQLRAPWRDPSLRAQVYEDGRIVWERNDAGAESQTNWPAPETGILPLSLPPTDSALLEASLNDLLPSDPVVLASQTRDQGNAAIPSPANDEAAAATPEPNDANEQDALDWAKEERDGSDDEDEPDGEQDGPPKTPRNYAYLASDYGRGWREAVYLALVPTPRAWEAPAYLRVGDWNACPPPAVHVALLKHWHDAYGAHLLGLGSDIVEVWVERPPTDPEVLRRLADEHEAYCPGDGPRELDAELDRAVRTNSADGSHWFFWWD